MKCIVIGGGIIGLSSALYLKRSGWEVTVLEKGDFEDNCSYGNCGYICPSHFIPLATPGIVKQGLKWMWNATSPFYVQPRLDRNLIDWGMKFMRSATREHVDRAAAPLCEISLLSQKEYETWNREGLFFAYEHKGLIELFQTAPVAEHARHVVEKAHALGLTDTRFLSKEETEALEPGVRLDVLGSIFFACDAHCHPNTLMLNLRKMLLAEGVQLEPHQEVTGFEKKGGKIQTVLTNNSAFSTDAVVLATGSWSREVAKRLDLRLPLMPGRGYSLTLEDSPYKVNYPSILVEGRAAITPMNGNKIRFGGTMEITSHSTPPRMNRVEGILKAVKRYYPDFVIPLPAPDKIWYGYRPCSADGLPYIGRVKKWENLVVATGHAMLGLSLGAGTGKLVSEILNEKTTSIPLEAFQVERFGGK